jgi:hypothetical protein
MTTPTTSLLIKFRKRDTAFGVTRETVKAIAERFEVSETEVVHLALSRLAREELPAYEADDGPLKAGDLKALRGLAKESLPKGQVVTKRSLF